MDKSFHNTSLSSVNRSFSLQATPKSKNRRSIFPSARKNISISGRSNASTVQVIARSEYNVVEVFGNSLPIKITELLTFSERNSSVSIAYSNNGWAWAVCGRKLLIWQYRGPQRSESDSAKIVKTSRTAPSQCRELTLPHCDIGHKAKLINVFVAEGSQTASCLAVSTTGDVRFWPSIAHDGSSIDENGILEGQEFAQLTGLSTQNYLLVTTTCHLVLLQLQIQNGRQRITHRIIRMPYSFLGGIGKRFSMIIGMSSQDSENKLIKISYESINSIEYHVNLLSEHSLQRWLFSPNSNEMFLYEEQEISKKIRDYFRSKMWPNRNNLNEPIDMWLLDMQTVDRGVIVLAAGANLSLTPQVFLVMITITAEPDNFQIKDFQLVRHKIFYNHQQQNHFLKFKFILCRGMAYIYSDRLILPVIIQSNSPLQPPIDDVEKIEFHIQDDRLLHAENIGNLPLFFSRIHGIVCVTPSDFAEPDYFNNSMNVSATNLSAIGDIFSPAPMNVQEQTNILSPNTTNAGNLSMYALDPQEIRENNRDIVSQLKAAFIYHLKRNSVMCHQIISELFGKSDGKQIDSQLDKTIVTIARDLAEDLPSSDPRWERELVNRSSTIALGSSTSMQIIQQLREKNFCMIKFTEFLHGVGLWSKLMGISEKGNVVKSTSCLLSDINEKIVATISIKCLHSAHSRLVDEAIEMIMNDNNYMVSGSLTNQDIFYTRITSIQEIFRKFAVILEGLVQEEVPNHQVQNSIIEINTIILQVLQEVSKFREQNSGLYKPYGNESVNLEYMPWTAASDENGLRDSLLQMIQLTLQQGIRLNGEGEYRFKHYQQMTDLIDFVLDGRRNYLTSIRNNQEKFNVLHHQYESQRFDLIYPLVEDEQYELAAKLAEKYLDFQILVIICDRTENQSRLDEYIERFKEQNFSQFAISWHMKQNKQGDLFERFRNNQADLAKFLHNHPSLAWIQLMFNGEMSKASFILTDLAKNEIELVARKKIMLSLAKLAAHAAEMDMTQHIENIKSELHLIEYQNQIDSDILIGLGFDMNNLRVLQPEEMIELYISPDYIAFTEIELRKALELLSYVEDSIEYRNKIWYAAIKMDNWLDINMDSPTEKISETIFYKLVELCYMLDNDLETFVPPIDVFLTAEELDELLSNEKFVYLIKLAYEYIMETFKC